MYPVHDASDGNMLWHRLTENNDLQSFTHHRYQKFLHLVDSSSQFQFRSVLCVINRDQHMKLLI